jgi:lysophospholipase L1-like esterase
MRDPRFLLLLIGWFTLAGATACDRDSNDDDSAPGPAGDDDDTGPDDDDTGGGDDDDDDTTAPPHGPALYPAGQVHSPIPPFTADALRAMATAGADDVFMKVGDSHTVTYGALPCLAGGSVDLGDHAQLQATLEFFIAGDAAGATPFDRDSLAAEGGMTASWAITGQPSPIDQEIAAIGPRFALVQYGTNDMGMGYTYASALWAYYEDMVALLDGCLDQGIVPAVMAIPHRGDATVAGWWVPTYNEVIRGLAQARQIPFIDLYLAVEDIPDQGLGGDGVHMSVGGDGCDLTADGLQYGNNVRNLTFLQALDRLRAVVVDGEPSLEPAQTLLAGDGSPQAPFEIPSIPFTHAADTSASPHSDLDLYTGCDSDSDESGPEYLYRLEVTEPTRMRAIVLDLEGVDIDIHLLDDTASEGGCLMRDHHLVETTLDPGTYHLALDSWVDDTDVLSGGYMLVVTTCHPDDTECD